MPKDSFKTVAINESHEKYKQCISRAEELYTRNNDIRSPFARDFNRILHCTAYRRLKHKTQVFFATTNDHICTRIEHVNHVSAISYTIASYLGLNTELTNAIAIGHDLGHAPFGHAGETFLREIAKNETGETFWHEKNSLKFVEDYETLEDPQRFHRNLNLTYAVRDGIILHCGEVDENGIVPRNETIDLNKIDEPSQYSPYTWEACVVKISDKIAYLGRDIEDALSLNLLSSSEIKNLKKVIQKYDNIPIKEINNTILIHNFIIDLCENSNTNTGICLSKENLNIMKEIKEYNQTTIYNHWKIENYKKYAGLVINSIFDILKRFYKGEKTLDEINKNAEQYPILTNIFREWILKYAASERRPEKYKNKILFELKNENDYKRAAIDFISGMTDSFAIKIFNEIIKF